MAGGLGPREAACGHQGNSSESHLLGPTLGSWEGEGGPALRGEHPGVLAVLPAGEEVAVSTSGSCSQVPTFRPIHRHV